MYRQYVTGVILWVIIVADDQRMTVVFSDCYNSLKVDFSETVVFTAVLEFVSMIM